ncbi:MAG: hypothetical protein ACOX6T_00955 [Myxococcales bacterium]
MPVSEPSTSGGSSHGHDGYRPSHPAHHHHHHHHHHFFHRYRCGRAFGYHPFFYMDPTPVENTAPRAPDRISHSIDFGNFMVHGEGIALGLGYAVEGQRFGFNLGASAIMVETGRTLDDGAHEVELGVSLVDAHLTWALLSSYTGRLRIEGGVSAALAPDLSAVGPEVGVSGALGIVGPLGIEGSAYYTPWPYTRVQAGLGAALGFEIFGLRLGWRTIYLDDGGVLGDEDTDDLFTGPYLSMGFLF